MKKALLSIGTIVSTIVPVASVIACGDGDVPGHEAPYSIVIQADERTSTQANVVIKLKGFISESYIKELKSKIAESIAAANKDTLKFSTIHIWVGSISSPLPIKSLEKIINATPLTNANKNDLDAIHTFLDSSFDSLINALKAHRELNQYFKKDAWENQHHQIDKLDKNEVKLRLLKLFGFENVTNPDVIDFEYEVISDKFMDFTITRTNVSNSPELISHAFATQDTVYAPFLEGEKINTCINFNSINKYDDNSLDINNDITTIWYKPETSSTKYGTISGSTGNRNREVQFYKLAKYLLKANGCNDDIKFSGDYLADKPDVDNNLKTLGNSASKIFAYGNNGQIAGINYEDDDRTPHYFATKQFQFDFDKKTFKLQYISTAYDQKQWIFGKNGDHLIIDPSHKWTLEFEGTYDIDDTDIKADSTLITKATATDGTHTIHLLESSSKLIANTIMKDLHWFFNGW